MRIKQYNVPRLGAFVESLYTVLPALSMVNFLLIGIAVYEPVERFLEPWFPWFNFTWFVIIMGSLVLGATILVYVIIVPSLNTFRYNQMNKFDSPVIKEIKALKAELANLRSNDGQEEFDIKTLVKPSGIDKSMAKRE